MRPARIAGYSLPAVSLALLAVLAAPAGPLAATSAKAPRVAGCKRVASPPTSDRRFQGPKQVVTPGETLTAVVKTSCGGFRIALDAERAPTTVNSFAFLADKGFYDRLTFHRAARGFVIQGGDPNGNGTGNPGYHVDEKPPSDLVYTKGTVAMAKAVAEPPGRSGSQFFVMLATHTSLPPEYAPIGRVVAGMEAVQRIGRLGTRSEQPRHPVVIWSISIVRG